MAKIGHKEYHIIRRAMLKILDDNTRSIAVLELAKEIRIEQGKSFDAPMFFIECVAINKYWDMYKEWEGKL